MQSGKELGANPNWENVLSYVDLKYIYNFLTQRLDLFSPRKVNVQSSLAVFSSSVETLVTAPKCQHRSIPGMKPISSHTLQGFSMGKGFHRSIRVTLSITL